MRITISACGILTENDGVKDINNAKLLNIAITRFSAWAFNIGELGIYRKTF